LLGGGGLTWEDLSTDEFIMGKGNFSLRGRRIPQRYLKNDQKLNKKNSLPEERSQMRVYLLFSPRMIASTQWA
jgi:hypothetical protein